MHSTNRTSQAPLQWLAQNSATAGLMHTARELLALQNVLTPALPPALQGRVRAASLRQRSLTLMVVAPAHAARLRQISTRLSEYMQTQGWQIDRIVIQIDAGMGALETKKPRQASSHLNTTALNAFDELAQKLDDGPLASAVRDLLRHHRKQIG